MALSPAQLRVARQIAAAAPGTDLDALLVATAMVESNLNPTAAGDGGRSHGVFQEYDLGRGAGIPISGRRNVTAATRRAYREYSVFRGRGFSGPELAYRAQRPADRASYVARIAQLLPIARQALAGSPASSPGGARARASRPPASGRPLAGGAGRTLTPESLAVLRRYADESERDVLAGRAPGDPNAVASQLSFVAPAPLPGAPASPRGPRAGGAAAGPVPTGRTRLTMGGGPEGHASRALGNWQSDLAYDLMGKAGQPIYSPVAGTVVKISGQPGGNPGFAGFGITVRTAQGDLFFKHLGSKRVGVGARIRPGDLVGTLDAATAGGPHLHLGGQNRAFLDRLARIYTGG